MTVSHSSTQQPFSADAIRERLKANIPAEMQQERRWLCFKAVPEKMADGTEKVSKKPVSAVSPDYPGKSTNPATWGTFEQALACIGRMSRAYFADGPIAGIGFVLGDGWAGIDLDGGAAHGGKVVPQSVLNDFIALGTYAEISMSGNGYHFIGRYSGPKLKENACKHESVDVEMYTDGRYFAITGNLLDGVTRGAADLTAALPALHEKYIAGPKRAAAPATAAPVRPFSVVIPSGGEQSEFMRLNIESLLDKIPADCDRNTWVRIGMALKAEGFPFDVFDSWSRTCDYKYNAADAEKAWKSFRAGGGINGGYIVKMAQENGWKPAALTDSFKRPTAQKDFAGVQNNSMTEQQTKTAPSADPETPCFQNGIEAMCKFMQLAADPDFRPIATGFADLDKALDGGLYPGLCIISGASSEGKSALAMHMVENMAASAGRDILVFSFEMSSMQLVSRSISRLTFAAAPMTAVTTMQALQANKWGSLPDVQQKAIQAAQIAYCDYAEHLYINDQVSPDVSTVCGQIRQYIEAKAAEGPAPVVLIDYLQLFNVPRGQTMADGLKDVTLQLKQIATKYNTTVILVSAVSRAAQQGGGLDFNSAYGSSFVEYSADYLFTLEFAASYAVSAGRLKESDYKRVRANLKKNPIRQMALTIQKSRMSGAGQAVGFDFNAAYSHFASMDEATFRGVLDMMVDKFGSDEKSSAQQRKKSSSNSQILE